MVRRTPSQLFYAKVGDVIATDIDKFDNETLQSVITPLKEFVAKMEDKVTKADYYKELKELKEKYGIVD